MVVINNQWQGSGKTAEILAGTHTLKQFFKEVATYEIPLSHNGLKTVNNIIAYESIFEQTAYYREIVSKHLPQQITTIGGDCGGEIIPVSYLNSKYARLGVIWFDAHADLNTPESSPSHAFHGMPVRLLLGEGDQQLKALCFSTLSPDQFLYIGLRDTDKPEKDFIEEKQIFHTPKFTYEEVITQITKQDFQYLYIHLDLDVLDPQEFVHSKYPTKNGVTINEIVTGLKMLRDAFNIVGYSITEGTMNTQASAEPIKEIIDFFVSNSA